MFNWYIQEGKLCGDLCVINIRQREYRSEKNTYKCPTYIEKRDSRYRATHLGEHRFHLYVKLDIVVIVDSIATVMYNNKEQQIAIQNMDSYFYLNDAKKRTMEERLAQYKA